MVRGRRRRGAGTCSVHPASAASGHVRWPSSDARRPSPPPRIDLDIGIPRTAGLVVRAAGLVGIPIQGICETRRALANALAAMRFLARAARAAASNCLSLSARLGRRLPYAKHRFPMKTTFKHCLLVNYSMDPAVLARSLPRGLTPDVVSTADGDRAFLSVVVADLEAMRLGFLPRGTGTDFTQVVYRAIVRAPTGERGVFFVRSDADDFGMGVAGNIFSNFNFNIGRCVWAGREELRRHSDRVLANAEDASRPELEAHEWLSAPKNGETTGSGSSSSFAFMLEPHSDASADGEPAGVRLSLDACTASLTMPSPSVFHGSDVREAQRFFVELYAAFASWPEHDHRSAVRIDRTNWHVVAVEPSQLDIDFMQRSSVFTLGEATYDSTFYVHALDYHWHAIDRQPFVLPSTRTTFPKTEALAQNVPHFFYDGSCPICVREVGHWRQLLADSEQPGRVELYDIAGPNGVGPLGTAFGVTLPEALARAHAIDSDGTLRTGISAFTVVWARLPYWHVMAWLFQTVPLATSIAECAYGLWASLRPALRTNINGVEQATTRMRPGASCRYVPGQKEGPPSSCA
eukprot:SAG31_NODE_3261_length_4483_cov_3.272582_5_plen_576_part_00